MCWAICNLPGPNFYVKASTIVITSRLIISARKSGLLQAQIDKNTEYYRKLENQREVIAADLAIERKALTRDSILLAETAISAADYETSLQTYLSKQNSEAGFDATLTSTELSIVQNQQQLVELSIQQENEIAEYERTLGQLRQQILAQIAQWKEQYTIIAPTDGQVSLHSYWSKGQHVSVGDILVSTVPLGKTDSEIARSAVCKFHQRVSARSGSGNP